MQLTLKGDYAVRVVVDLAAQGEAARVRMDDLHHRTEVPPAYLSKIVQRLARSGVVRTQRGARGGVALAASPASLTLRAVIEAVEGPIHLNRCLVTPGTCPRERGCTVRPVWARVQSVLTRELEAVRIEDLVKHGRARRIVPAGHRKPPAPADPGPRSGPA